MRNRNWMLWVFVLIIFSCSSQPERGSRQTQVPFTDVHINDAFWAPKIEINRKVSIPSAFHQCEINGRFDNFALAGGLINGVHRGDFPFDDTDVYKIVEGASYNLAVSYDLKLDRYLDSLIVLIGAGQEEDGYLTTCVTNKCERLRPWYGKGRWDRLNSHELYNSGHLYEAAVAHFQATGKRTLLDIAIKNANLVDQIFGPEEGKLKVPSGHPIIEMALVKLFRVTGEERYLKLAKFFIDETGKGTDGHRLNPYSQDHQPIVDQGEAVGHAVRLGYLYSGVTDVASVLGDSALLAASKRVWNNVVGKKLYITGGIGSRAQGEGFGGNFELNNMTSYCETCAAIANIYWNYRLFLNEPDSKYFDVLERTLYNGLLSGVSLSGDLFFYDNPLESDGSHERAPWFGCACCPGNVTRFMASVPGYVYSSDEHSIHVNLFVGNEAKIAFGSDSVVLKQTTNYPWDGDVELSIENPSQHKFDLMVRIPGWAASKVVPSDLYHYTNNPVSEVEFKLNGKPVHPVVSNGYAVITKKWKSGDRLSISFPMEIQKITAGEQVQSDRGKLAYQRGPLIYCFEGKDNHDSWLFDTYVAPEAQAQTGAETDLPGGMTAFTIPGFRVSNDSVQPVVLKAIPYFAWNNRGKSNMLVWMPVSKDRVFSKLVNRKESTAKTSASFDFVTGLNDGFDPENSADIDKPFFSWWKKDQPGGNWVEYSWDKAVNLSQTSVYWLQTDHYDGNYRMPQSWTVQYLTGSGTWADVMASDPYSTNPDTYNVVRFKEIHTTALRLNVNFQSGCSAGILEWKVD